MWTMLYNINFGRKLYDKLLALDPTKFRNVQLRIVHDKALGGNTPTAGSLAVWADIFDDKVPSLQGYLQSKEHYSVADSSSAINYVDLPTDYVIRRLLVMSDCDDKYPHQQFNKLKLTEEHDKVVILDQSVSALLKRVCQAYPAYIEDVHTQLGTVAKSFYVTSHYEQTAVGAANAAGAGVFKFTGSGGGQLAFSASAASNISALVRGWAVHGAIPIDFGDQQDVEDWWDVTRLGSARLRITQGGSVSGSDTIEVITQQLRSY